MASRNERMMHEFTHGSREEAERLKAQMTPQEKEALLSHLLGELTDRAIDESQQG